MSKLNNYASSKLAYKRIEQKFYRDRNNCIKMTQWEYLMLQNMHKNNIINTIYGNTNKVNDKKCRECATCVQTIAYSWRL